MYLIIIKVSCRVRVIVLFLLSWWGQMPASAQKSSPMADSVSLPTQPNQRRLLVLPLVARSIETAWSFGVASSLTFRLTDDSTTRTSNTQAIALYSLRRQFVVALNGTTYFPGERYILNHQVSYSYFPDKFWGLGKDAPEAAVESYTFRQYYIYLHLQRQVRPDHFVGLLYEFQRVMDVDYRGGGLFDQQNVPGRKPYHVSGAGLSYTYDSRNSAFSPDKGGLVQVQFNHFAPLFGSDFQYTNYVLDARLFRRVGRQVIALQAYAFLNSGDVPLRSLASFGGSNSMRGYYDGRYRDRNQAVLQAEYRSLLFWRFGAVVFGGLGNLAYNVNELNWQRLKFAYGAGLRVAVNQKERLNLRIDYGFGGTTGSGLYFQLGEAF